MVSVDDLMAEAVLFLRHEFQSQNVKVAHLPSTGIARVNVDRIQIQQVIVNMAVNAVQAISTTNSNSREVLLRTTCEGPNVRCSVEDSGPVIAMDQSNRIFEFRHHEAWRDGDGVADFSFHHRGARRPYDRRQ